VNDYYTTLENECEPIGYAINPNIAIVTGFMCDNDQERATKMGQDGLQFFSYALAHHYIFGRHEPGKTDIWQNYAAHRNGLDIPGAAGPNSCIGTPELIRQRLRDYQEAGVDQVVFISQAGNNKHEDICDSLNLFARSVLSEFKEQHEARDRLKMDRIAPILYQAMKRKREPEIPKSDGPTIIQAGMLP
ncbi:MAG: LLM class flavin-dependent oxidoreductase, partial [Candidatus Binataceae bacterium]